MVSSHPEGSVRTGCDLRCAVSPDSHLTVLMPLAQSRYWQYRFLRLLAQLGLARSYFSFRMASWPCSPGAPSILFKPAATFAVLCTCLWHSLVSPVLFLFSDGLLASLARSSVHFFDPNATLAGFYLAPFRGYGFKIRGT